MITWQRGEWLYIGFGPKDADALPRFMILSGPAWLEVRCWVYIWNGGFVPLNRLRGWLAWRRFAKRYSR